MPGAVKIRNRSRWPTTGRKRVLEAQGNRTEQGVGRDVHAPGFRTLAVQVPPVRADRRGRPAPAAPQGPGAPARDTVGRPDGADGGRRRVDAVSWPTVNQM